MEPLEKLLERKSPEEALAMLADTAKTIFRHVDERCRLDFVMRLIDEAGTDKIASLVNL